MLHYQGRLRDRARQLPVAMAPISVTAEVHIRSSRGGVQRQPRDGVEVDPVDPPDPIDPPGPIDPPMTTTVREITATATTGADGSFAVELPLPDGVDAERAFVSRAHVDFAGVRTSTRPGSGGAPFALDLAKAIVGHTTPTTARIWLCRHGDPSGVEHVLEVRSGQLGAWRAIPVTFDAAREHTATIDVAELTAGENQYYRLRAVVGGRAFTLVDGGFRTIADEERGLRIAAGSCHRVSKDPDGARWRDLATNLAATDLLLLTGDQVYESDAVVLEGFGDTWRERYRAAYHRSFTPQAVRDVIGNVPTYMILDDHEIMDDWGTQHTLLLSPPDVLARARDALDAYDIFQHAHNPPTPSTGGGGAGIDDKPRWYAFHTGPAVGFVMDLRTCRKLDVEHPVLGIKQWEAFSAWAASEEVRNADVVVVVSSIPLAVAERRVLGAADFFDGTGADTEEQWALGRNQEELRRVLDILISLASEAGHPRIVITVGGDIHVGQLHEITGFGVATSLNPYIYQLTSSPLTNSPPGWAIAWVEGWEQSFDLVGPYTAHRLGDIVRARNTGRIEIEGVRRSPRKYRLRLTLDSFEDGRPRQTTRAWEIDLGTLPVTRVPIAEPPAPVRASPLRSWRYIGDIERPTAATGFHRLGERLLVAADDRLQICDPREGALNWRTIGDAAGVTGLAVLGNQIYATTADGRTRRRSTAEEATAWEDLVTSPAMVSLAIIGEQLYGVSADGALWTRGLATPNEPWLPLGQAPGMTAIVGLGGVLLGAARDGQLSWCFPGPQAPTWRPTDELGPVRALAHHTACLYAIADDGRVFWKHVTAV
jgi:hypothetical protein